MRYFSMFSGIGGESGRKVFPIGESNGSLDEEDEGVGSTDDGTRISNMRTGPSQREHGWQKTCPTLLARDYKDPKVVKVADFRTDEGLRIRKDNVAPCLTSHHNSENSISYMPPLSIDGMMVRRLTPTECERLQGFPDGWTKGISDSQRYKCLGNAVTVNVIEAIIERLL